jgi:hypothetical protein
MSRTLHSADAICSQAMPDDSLLGAYLWRTVRGQVAFHAHSTPPPPPPGCPLTVCGVAQGCGGIRLRHYETLEEYVRDGLRCALPPIPSPFPAPHGSLATGMGRKSALAGLWWGGGKGPTPPDPSLPCFTLACG